MEHYLEEKLNWREINTGRARAFHILTLRSMRKMSYTWQARNSVTIAWEICLLAIGTLQLINVFTAFHI